MTVTLEVSHDEFGHPWFEVTSSVPGWAHNPFASLDATMDYVRDIAIDLAEAFDRVPPQDDDVQQQRIDAHETFLASEGADHLFEGHGE